MSPNPELLIMECSSSCVICPNALGIHNAGYSYDDDDDDDDDHDDDVSGCICMSMFLYLPLLLYNIINFLYY